MTSAQGDRVGHYGETEVTLQEVSTGKLANFHFEVMDVARPIVAVSAIARRGGRVVLVQGGDSF
eukprot:728519-Alexandrium_andersonii.AAC.1